MKVLGASRAPAAAFEPLRAAGHEVVITGAGARRGEAPDELTQMVRDADIAVGVNLPAEVMPAAERLRAIVTTSIGIDRVDVPAATRLGILVCNSPSPENYNGVSEATIGLLIALATRMKRKEAVLRAGGWGQDSDRGMLLMNRTLGIVGLGRIGLGVAQRLKGWGMRVIGYDHGDKRKRAAAAGVEQVATLEDVFAQSDFVSIHLVLTPKSRGMIGEPQLRLMKPSAYLVNTSRGPVIDEAALERALREEWIAGAALDVFEQEPLPLDSHLRQIDPERLILTPHAISHTVESRAGGIRMAVESALTLLEGRIPEAVVNREALPAWQKRFGRA